MKPNIELSEMLELRKNRIKNFQSELDSKKRELTKEEAEINSFIEHAHNLYILNSYQNDDNEGIELRALHKKLLVYCVGHIKKYKLISSEIDNLKKKIEYAKVGLENTENVKNKLLK